MNGQQPDIRKFLPPPPDEFFAGALNILTNVGLAIPRAIHGAIGQAGQSVEQAASTLANLPRRE
jgi:hypothetical protein